jgi:hypothetical protein
MTSRSKLQALNDWRQDNAVDRTGLRRGLLEL